MSAIIQINNLTKIYTSRKSETKALENLTLTVQAGEIFGYLGPNGAGKTTTIRLLLDLIRPTSGSASIFGLDARKDSIEIHKQVGFLPGELNLWKNRTGLQIIKYLAKIRDMDSLAYAYQLADRLKLDLSKKVRDYSSGNKRKLGIVLALMHQPKLLILDEPTGGLDPLMQQTFNQLMREARNEGRTVFLSSHVLSEVQAICDRVGILRDGVLQSVQRVEDLTHVDFRWVELHFRQPIADNWVANLEKIDGVSNIQPQDNHIRLRLHGDFDPVFRAVAEGYITDLHVEDPSLEEIFLTFYGGEADTVFQENV